MLKKTKKKILKIWSENFQKKRKKKEKKTVCSYGG